MQNGPLSHSQHENCRSDNMALIGTDYQLLNNRKPTQSHLSLSYFLVSDKHCLFMT